jgi:hypothetical protein
MRTDAKTKGLLDEAAARAAQDRAQQLECERALGEQLLKDNPPPRQRQSHVEPTARHARVRWRRYAGR